MHAVTPVPARDEEGFSLVELLVAIVIMGIIVGALGAALTVALRTTDDANARLLDAQDLRLVGSYLPADVASAQQVTVPPAGAQPAATGSCGDSAPLVLRLSWRETSATRAGTAIAEQSRAIAVEYVRPGVGAEQRLERRVCAGEGSTTPTDVTVVARRFTGSPTVACSSDCNAAPPDAPRQVSMTLTSTGGAVYTARAERRSA